MKDIIGKKFAVVVSFVIIGVITLAVVNIISVTGILVDRTTHSKIELTMWGDDEKGQLGQGYLTPAGYAYEPKEVRTPDMKQIYGGLQHSLGLTQSGEVFAWGSNEYGQMGNGQKGGSQVSPKRIDGIPKMTMLATKQDHNLALDDSGRIWAWGLNMSGQLGDSTNDDRVKPRLVPGIKDVKFIAAGYRSSIAVKKDGSVWVWGGNCNIEHRNKSLKDYITQLSVGGYSDTSGGTISHITPKEDCLYEDYINIKSYIPKRVEGLPPIESIEAGFGHMLALTEDGELWAWGCNMYGQAGNGQGITDSINHIPTKIKGIGRVKQVAAGFRHSLALTDDGKLWGWGHNYFGDLGNGKELDESFISSPIALPILDHISSIYAGHDYSLAVTDDGKLWGWGQASAGQLGEYADYKNTPTRLFTLTNVKKVAAGGAHVIVIAAQKDKE